MRSLFCILCSNTGLPPRQLGVSNAHCQSRVRVHYDVEEFLRAYQLVSRQIEAGYEVFDFALHLAQCILYFDLLLLIEVVYLVGVEVARLHALSKSQQLEEIFAADHARTVRVQKFEQFSYFLDGWRLIFLGFTNILLEQALIKKQVEEVLARHLALMLLFTVHIVDAFEQCRIKVLILHIYVAEECLQMRDV